MKNTKLLLPLLLVAPALISCPDEGPAERAGEKIDEAADDVGDAVEEAGDEVEDAVDDNK
jgi:hypothetical protein